MSSTTSASLAAESTEKVSLTPKRPVPAELDAEEDGEPDTFHLFEEARLLFGIAVPTVAVQFSIFFLYPQTASALGRTLGTEELAGFSLASLAGNVTCLSCMMGVLTASDTLQPRAFGTSNFAEVGRLAIRGFAACVLVLIPPVIPLIFCTEAILNGLGQDPYASLLASEWVRIYLVGVPAVMTFRVVQRFLACQHIVMPMVFAAAIGCFLVHPILLKLLVPAWGFLGSGAAVIMTQTVQAGLILLYLALVRPHEPRTWPGLSKPFLAESLRPRRMRRYLRLSLGGVLSFSEWWFWEVMCFTAGTFGIVPFCVHSIAYQLIPTLFMIPLGISIGLSVRIGNVLAYDVDRAKRITVWCMGFTATLAAIIAFSVYKLEDHIVALFTVDEEVIEGCHRLWPKLSVYIFILNIFGVNSGILRALGLQWRMAATIFCVLWCCTLPIIYCFAVWNGGGLQVMWTILPCAYIILNFVLIYVYITADWHEISEEIKAKSRRSIVEVKDPNEGTRLLNGETLQSGAAELAFA